LASFSPSDPPKVTTRIGFFAHAWAYISAWGTPERVGLELLSLHPTREYAELRWSTSEKVGSQFLSLHQFLPSAVTGIGGILAALAPGRHVRSPMRFLDSSPDIPDELIRAVSAGEVMFLCGAGVSFGAGFAPLSDPSM
jgi:hypothetical protein